MTNTLACRGYDLVSLILDDLLEYHHQRSRSHAQHDYAIDGFERAGAAFGSWASRSRRTQARRN